MANIPDHEIAQAFVECMRSNGVSPAEPISNSLLSGKLIRFKVGDDRRANGWAVLHRDGRPAGAFGCNKRGIKGSWKLDGANREWSKQEKIAYAKQMAAKREAAAAEKAAAAEAVAQRAAVLLGRANEADPTHPYLQSKQIAGIGLLQIRTSLIVPMHDADGKLWNAQFISAEGEKRFYTGGRTAGLCWSIVTRSDRVFVGEGMATMGAVHRATGCTVYAAFSAGNLTEGARLARSAHPDADITICADDDAHLIENPTIKRNIGLDAAKAAASAIGGRVAVPSRRN